MKKPVTITVLALTLTVTLILLVPAADAYIGSVTIESPTNTTYNSKDALTLTATAHNAPFQFENQTYINYSIFYSIDGQPQIPMSENSKAYTGTVTLPKLSEGNHTITVTAQAISKHDGAILDVGECTINFTIDATPPDISLLLPQSVTYNQNGFPLTFTVNEPTSRISYSLDDAANVTIAGNTTLIPQTGPHNLILYANDTAGNIGASQTMNFTVAEPFPFLLVVAVLAAVAVGVAGLVVYFKRNYGLV